MLKHKEFLNENNKKLWVYDGDVKVTRDMVDDGRFIKVKIPDIIYGDFDCSFNQLTSLEGGPIKVGGHFYCSNNQLTSLERGPKEVRGYFDSSGNINDLSIEKNFIGSGSFKTNFYKDLLDYCLKNTIDIDNIKSWPENFLTDNIKTSSKGLNKFKL